MRFKDSCFYRKERKNIANKRVAGKQSTQALYSGRRNIHESFNEEDTF